MNRSFFQSLMSSIGVRSFGVMVVFFLMSKTLWACNIPVFRYALERWQSDNFQVLVFYEKELSSEERDFIERLRKRSAENGGDANASLKLVNLATVDPSGKSVASELALWNELRPRSTLPQIVVASKSSPDRFGVHATLSLSEARQCDLFDSPVRRELRTRLLAGHSVVWLLVSSTDKKQTDEVGEKLESTFGNMVKSIKLPEGIGLQGSELYSDVPLFQKFSELKIDRNDPNEKLLVDWFRRVRPDAFDSGEAVLIPVFGRGRALEVIPANDFSAKLIEDLTIFLSGACSCQVKQRNPGFDLLMEADWDTELFGDEGDRPHDRTEEEGKRLPPQLVPIPSGR